MLRITVMSVFCVAFSLGAYSQPEKIIERFMAKGNVPGMFVAVVRGDTVLYQKSFGLADIQRGVPLTDATCMELGSISKAFTAEAIYSIEQTGLINTQDPIRKYFPEAPSSWSDITIQHLLSHSSGILNYLLDPRFHAASYFTSAKEPPAKLFPDTIAPDSMVQLFYSLPLEFKPGFSWSYSNTGYYLLGKIAEAVSDKPFFELVADKVTDPLQMSHTKANERAAKEQCLATGYFLKDSLLTPSLILHSNYAFSAGGWATTGLDMIRFLKAIHRRSLPSDKLAFDWRKPSKNNALPFSYNGGRFYTTFHGMQIISHNGGTAGFSSSWIYAVDKNISIIILMNRQDYAAIDQLAWEVLSFIEPILKYPQKERIEPEQRKRAQKLLAVLESLKSKKPFPQGLAMPLEHFLLTENGRGYWKWYFERGFPKSAHCVEVEQFGNATLYRFLLPLSQETVYQLSVLENEKGEWTQIRWW